MIELLAVFAIYRLATDLAWERGPYDVYARLRGAVMAAFGPDDWRSEGVACPICWSFWIGLPVALLLAPWPHIVLYWLGMSGAAAWLARQGATHD